MLARWQRTIVDQAGNIIPGAEVTVRDEVGGSLAPLFSDRDGTVPIGNPFNAEPDGFAAFHVAGGAYRIDVVDGAFSQTLRYVPVGTAAEKDATTIGDVSGPDENEVVAGQIAIFGDTSGKVITGALDDGSPVEPFTVSNLLALIAAAGGGGSYTFNLQTFTASGTYTPTAGLVAALAIAAGGGGGGGGADAADTSSAVAGGGGSSGTLAVALLTALQIGASQSVTIGAGGGGGTGSSGSNGSNGSTTSLGTLLVALGGLAGSGASDANVGRGEAAGAVNDSSGNTGDFVSDGNPGTNGTALDAGPYRTAYGGNGGASLFGGAGLGARVQNTLTSSGVNGGNGTLGGGGGGGAAQSSPNDGTGGDGGAGFVFILELIAS